MALDYYILAIYLLYLPRLLDILLKYAIDLKTKYVKYNEKLFCKLDLWNIVYSQTEVLKAHKFTLSQNKARTNLMEVISSKIFSCLKI